MLWDDIDIAVMDPESLRAWLAVAFQDFGRFSRAWPSLDLDPDNRARIEAAGRQAGADEFIRRLRSGYDTTLGRRLDERADLSGGQCNGSPLPGPSTGTHHSSSWDEPTASLDAMAEHELFDTIQTLFAGRSRCSSRIASRP